MPNRLLAALDVVNYITAALVSVGHHELVGADGRWRGPSAPRSSRVSFRFRRHLLTPTDDTTDAGARVRLDWLLGRRPVLLRAGRSLSACAAARSESPPSPRTPGAHCAAAWSVVSIALAMIGGTNGREPPRGNFRDVRNRRISECARGAAPTASPPASAGRLSDFAEGNSGVGSADRSDRACTGVASRARPSTLRRCCSRSISVCASTARLGAGQLLLGPQGFDGGANFGAFASLSRCRPPASARSISARGRAAIVAGLTAPQFEDQRRKSNT